MRENQLSAKHSRGIALVEMTIVTPVLLLLVLSVVEITNVLQATSILTSVSREAASLASRGVTDSHQKIMEGLAQTTTPLDFPNHGSMYITLIASDEGAQPFVAQQYRWREGSRDSNSRIWSGCAEWEDDGSCLMSAEKPRLADFSMPLEDGDAVYVVETLYDYRVLNTLVFESDIALYARTLM